MMPGALSSTALPAIAVKPFLWTFCHEIGLPVVCECRSRPGARVAMAGSKAPVRLCQPYVQYLSVSFPRSSSLSDNVLRRGLRPRQGEGYAGQPWSSACNVDPTPAVNVKPPDTFRCDPSNLLRAVASRIRHGLKSCLFYLIDMFCQTIALRVRLLLVHIVRGPGNHGLASAQSVLRDRSVYCRCSDNSEMWAATARIPSELLRDVIEKVSAYCRISHCSVQAPLVEHWVKYPLPQSRLTDV